MQREITSVRPIFDKKLLLQQFGLLSFQLIIGSSLLGMSCWIKCSFDFGGPGPTRY